MGLVGSTSDSRPIGLYGGFGSVCWDPTTRRRARLRKTEMPLMTLLGEIALCIALTVYWLYLLCAFRREGLGVQALTLVCLGYWVLRSMEGLGPVFFSN